MCFFCKMKGYMKKDCMKHKVWLEKKCISFSFICYESNFINFNHNTWWIDYGSTILVSNTLQGMRNLRKPMGCEKYIHLGGSQAHMWKPLALVVWSCQATSFCNWRRPFIFLVFLGI